ncbi:hypothetical protein SLEP1_g8474 [Rubroshorea leprosula]|uniref:Uncharacterized protein n=1 Tax=Rubroshorea leprosula TaxID=152421 RepID=A0AAV5IAV6_9ROSI|nr:hypothetical protein SLEP1_g8474 [Rubroshorea leprosula]
MDVCESFSHNPKRKKKESREKNDPAKDIPLLFYHILCCWLEIVVPLYLAY